MLSSYTPPLAHFGSLKFGNPALLDYSILWHSVRAHTHTRLEDVNAIPLNVS